MRRYPFTISDELRLAKAARNGDTAAMQKLVAANVPLAASKLRGFRLYDERDDVMQELCIAMIGCAKRYTGKYTFASFWAPHVASVAQNWRRKSMPRGHKWHGAKPPPEVRLDAPIKNHEEHAWGDMMTADSNQHDEFERAEIAAKVRAACNDRRLDARERKMLSLWLKADPEICAKNSGHSDVARDMELSRERVRQLWNQMIPKLREILAPLDAA